MRRILAVAILTLVRLHNTVVEYLTILSVCKIYKVDDRVTDT